MSKIKEFFDKFGKVMFGLTFFIVSILASAVFLGYPIMWLWNYVCPALFNLPVIDFYHAWALLVLSGMLFKSPK